MTKDEALDLALEAAYLAGFNASGEGYNGEYPFRDHGAPPEQDAGWIKNRDNELTAIKQAHALDKMAENARELGLDYEPVQEPVAWWNGEYGSPVFAFKRDTPGIGLGNPDATPLYTTPPAQPAPVQEPVAYDKTELNCFAQDLYDQKMREGKRGHYESMFHVIHQCVKKVAPPPAAQRQWVGLTDEQIEKVWRRVQANDFHDCVQPFAQAIEAKLKEKNTP
jgi:hypothetical protein